jgi:putative flippase GtrA
MNALIRWLKFNFVGAIGVVLQLALLAAFTHAMRWNYMVATCAAVELTVLHNFAWHERFTWRDRAFSGGMLARLLRFHTGNGLVSVVGNMALMRWLVGELHVPVLVANAMAILVCSLINFFLADRWIFATQELRTEW